MTRILLDACVLFPSVLREILLGVAKTGYYTPLWSDRILEEWHRAAIKKDAATGATAGIEIALLKSAWPDAIVPRHLSDQDGLILPDAADIHVLASAITGRSTAILTANSKDFPTRILAQFNILRYHPDTYLLDYAIENKREISHITNQIHEKAQHMAASEIPLRKLLKGCGLPRLAKHLAAQG